MANFTGGTGNDTVAANAGAINDVLTGLAGNDTLIGLGGADVLDGGTGTDTADYTASAAAVNANLTTLSATGGDAQGDTYISIENLTGSGYADTLTGGTGANVLSGLAGNDSLYGGAGNDVLLGGAGADRIDGGADIDTVSYAAATAAVNVSLTTGLATGGEGADTLVAIENVIGSAFADTIVGDLNNNVIAGGAGADTLDGGAGIDTVDYSASATAVTINMLTGVNTGGDAEGDILANFENIRGSAGADRLTGNANDNILIGGAGADTLEGDAGNDTVDYSASSAGVNVSVDSNVAGLGGDAQGDRLFGIENLIGSAFNDTLTGGDDVNVLTGGAGNDVLNGGGENDTMIGGAGDDSYVVGSSAETITELLNEGNDLVSSAVAFTLGANIERLTLTGSLDVNGTGNELANILTGNSAGIFSGQGMNILRGLAGNDTIYGMGGGDVLDGGTGNDSLIGGTGGDLYQVDSLNDVLVEAVSEGNDTVQTTVNWTLATNFEYLILDDAADINGTGNTVANRITGNAGNNLLSGLDGGDTLIGNAGNDTLNGGAGLDSMTGGIGDDYYVVDAAGDTIVELDAGGIDTMETSVTTPMDNYVENLIMSGVDNINATGNASNNVMTGNAGNNNMTGGTGGNDTLYGGAGNDSLDGGTGNDSVAGGVGDDTYTVNATLDVVTELSDEGIDTVITGATWTMSANIENLRMNGSSNINAVGNALANTMTGNSMLNLLQGMAGNDSLYGGVGGDTLDGGTGDDSLTGGTGNDTFVLDNANDVMVENFNEGTDTVQTTFNYTLLSNFENLTLLGTSGLTGTGNTVANLMTGNTGANLLQGMAGVDTLIGGAGNDTLDGGTGNDSLVGGDNDDRYIIDSIDDVTLESSATGGIDTVDTTVNWTLTTYTENLNLLGSTNLEGHGNSLSNILTGNTGNNLLTGESGNDTLNGGAGNDTLNGGTGNDSMSGGAGDDFYYTDSANDVLFEAANAGIDTVTTSVNWTLGGSFENLVLGGLAGLTGTGSAIANVITGNGGSNNLSGMAGNDTIDAGAGADTLNGGTGDDSMIGGLGNDTYYVDSLNDVVVELDAAGTDRVFSSVDFILADTLENLTLNGTAAINGTGNLNANVMVGNANDNLLSGMAGNDSITASAGNDTLDGGTGSDTLIGGLGDDSYIVDNVNDRVTELTSQGTDTVYASVSYSIVSTVENLTLTGGGNINATGNSSANVLTGNAGNNVLLASTGNDTLDGDAGNDTLDGGTGNDVMSGGLGHDTYVIDSLGDVVSEDAAAGIDLVRASVSHVLGANFENLTLTGLSGINGTGNALNNVLTGNAGKNILNGGVGSDTLIGNGGPDVLIGGTGADHFVFTTASTTQVSISDFNALDGGAAEGDVLEFVGLLTGNFAYIGAAVFSGGDNTEARFIAGAVQLDFNGDGTSDLTIKLDGLTADSQLSGSDFLFT